MLVKLTDTDEKERTAQSNVIKHMGREQRRRRGASPLTKSKKPATPPFKGFMLRSGGWFVGRLPMPDRTTELLERRTFRAIASVLLNLR